MAGERDVLAEARETIAFLRSVNVSAETLSEASHARIDAVLARLAPSPEPLPLDVERLARALGNWCRYRSESCDEPSPCSHDWSLARTLFRDMAEPREPAP